MKILLLMIFLTSCAGMNQKTLTSTGMPKLKLKKHQIFLNERRIASVSDDEDLAKQSNKNIYFFSLLTQFNKLKSLGHITQMDLNSCPAFHDDMLKFKSKDPSFNHFKNPKLNIVGYSEKALLYFPELNLPLGSGNEILAQSNKENFNNDFKAAIKHHAVKTYSELGELCDKGSSSNYYVYVNFIRHLKQKPQYYHQDSSFHSLVNIPIIGNIVMLESLNKDFSFTQNISYETEALRRVKAWWIYSYVNNLKETRNKLSFKDSPNHSEPFQNALSSYPRVFGR